MTVHIQYTIDKAPSEWEIPSEALLTQWVDSAIGEHRLRVEITLRIVDEVEMTQLNETYRHKSGPTNVLSFVYDDVPGIAADVVGDIALCAPVIAKEAVEQNKFPAAHWAHMVIHGVFHLIGHDHQTETQALHMEALERQTLENLGFPDPYETLPRSPDDD